MLKKIKKWWDRNKIVVGAVIVMLFLTLLSSPGLLSYVQGKPSIVEKQMISDIEHDDFDMSFLQRLMDYTGLVSRKPAIIVVDEQPPFYPKSPVKEPSSPRVYTADFTGRIYTIGTSISNGYRFHDADHSRFCNGGDRDGFYNYFFDEHMKNVYNIKTDISDWYHNKSWRNTWDKFNLGTGGFMNTYTMADGVDPWPSNSSFSGKGMCLDCVDDTINMTWGRGLWRIKDVDWSGKFLIVEGGHHDGNQGWEGENSSGMAADIMGIYEQSRFYGYTLVLVGHLPVGEYGNQNVSVVRDTNVWRKNFSENHSDMVYVDLCGSVFFKDDGSADERFFVEDDGFEVHPNKKGLRVLGEMIADCVYGFWVEQGMI